MLTRTIERIGWLLLACVVFVACASSPEPRTSKRKSAAELKKSKKKKKKPKKAKKPKVVAAAESSDDDDTRGEDAPSSKPKKSKFGRSDDDADDDADEKPAKTKRSTKDADEEERDDEEEDDKSKARAKREAAAEAKAEREAKAKAKREAEAEEKAERVAAAKAEREEKAKAKREADAAAKAEREEKAKAKREADAEAKASREADAKAKRDKAKRTASKDKPDKEDKEDEEEEEEEEEEDDDADDADSPPPKVGTKPAKATARKPKESKEALADQAKKKPPADEEAVIDMTGDEGPTTPPPPEDDDDREPADLTKSDDDDPLTEKRVAAIPVPGIDAGEPEPEKPETPLPSSALIGRPYTVAPGAFELHGGLRYGVITARDPVAMTSTSTSTTSLLLGGAYGIGDRLELGGDYAVGLSPGSIKGPLTFRATYAAKTGGKLEIALAGGLALDFATFTDAMMMTTTTTYAGLQVGFWMRYRVGHKVSIFTGNPALPTTSPGLAKVALPLPPFNYQLAVGLNNAGSIALEVPIGVGIQATPKLYAFGMLDIAHIRIANTTNAFAFADFIPVAIGGFYTVGSLDIGGVFADDLSQGTDYLRFDMMLRFAR